MAEELLAALREHDDEDVIEWHDAFNAFNHEKKPLFQATINAQEVQELFQLVRPVSFLVLRVRLAYFALFVFFATTVLGVQFKEGRFVSEVCASLLQSSRTLPPEVFSLKLRNKLRQEYWTFPDFVKSVAPVRCPSRATKKARGSAEVFKLREERESIL